MPPPSKRKSAIPLRSLEPATKRITKEVEPKEKFFASYANPSIGMIDPEGVEKLCSDLDMKHTDVRILILVWKMNAKTQGYITQDEWRHGLRLLRADTLTKLKNQLPMLWNMVKNKENFGDFYQFSFRYNLTDNQKTLDIETACILLHLLLGCPYDLQVNLLIEYLKIQKEYKVINMDQWTYFYHFCDEIDFPEFKNYDECPAWPLILDNFVAWMKREKFPPRSR